MILLTLGVALWMVAHMFHRVAPQMRAEMGGKGRALVSGAVVVAVILMIIGYRSAESTFFWGRSPMMTGINNLLMLISVYLFAASGMKTKVAQNFRHPMLLGVLLWSVAHLLVNGDTASFVLFGGIALWSLVQMALVSASGPFVPPVGKGPKMEIFALLGTVIVFGAIAMVHKLLGYPVFG